MKRISASFNPKNKRSVKNLHEVLNYLREAPVYEGEAPRRFGSRTRDAIRELLGDVEVSREGKLSSETIEKLNERLISKKYRDQANIALLHEQLRTLQAKGFVQVDLAEDEIQAQEIGPSTREFIRAFQEKYRLGATGRLDSQTEERLESVITSIAGSKPQPKKLLRVKNPAQLNRTVKYLRLNMQGPKVKDLQKNLSWLGYTIHEQEFQSGAYGKTTQKAVQKFQSEHNLPLTGSVDSATSKALNQKLAQANPTIQNDQKFRVRGSVRDQLWKGKSGVTVQVFQKALRGPDVLLGQRKPFDNGFYDILFMPPQEVFHSRMPLNLVVKVVDDTGGELHSKTYYKVKKVQWVNFTEGDSPYRGASDYELGMKLLAPTLSKAGLDIMQIEESDASQDVVLLYRETGVLPEEIMKLSLASRIAGRIGRQDELPPEVFYAFLRQNLPPELPEDLFPDEPGEWDEWIPRVVERVADGIVFLDSDIQQGAIEEAFQRNYLPRELKLKRDQMIEALKAQAKNDVLNRPLLVGDGTIKMLLDQSSVEPGSYTRIAEAFMNHQGITKGFWEELDASDLDEDQVRDLKLTVDLGVITKNHQPTLQVLRSRIDDPADSALSSPRELAKLSHGDWVSLLEEGGGGVPDNLENDNESESLNTYAATLKSRTQRLYPDVALLAELGRTQEHGLTQLASVAQFLDSLPDFNLALDNLEKYSLENENLLSGQALEEAKVVQRIHRISPSPPVGVALLNKKLHNSMQIYFKGQDGLVEILDESGVPRQEIIHAYRLAEHQYSRVLADIARFRFDFFGASPPVVPDFTYTPEEIDEFKNDSPNLEVLFGALDYCDCRHCSSVYSPAAYFTDLLRFLEEKAAIPPGQSVRDILLDRRPDLGNIKLNCDNTHTPLPYIDLVNEVLENAIPPAASDFSYQSTLSAEELRAVPEHIRPHAYQELKGAQFPMHVCFNLWQEQTRLFLQHLGVPRHRLMEVFQNRSNPASPSPPDVDIAGEYFGISSEEQAILLPPASEANAVNQDEYWGFDSTRSTIPVSEILKKSRLEYDELLELLQARFVNPESNQSVINRPVDDCDVDKQTIDNLSLAKLDRMHRFLRLWRKSGWQIWELDLLIRNPGVGNGALDADCLVALKQVKKLQEKLSLSVEEVLSFYGPINAEIRFAPDETSREIRPLYHRLFLNIAVSNPVDTAFELPIVAAPLAARKATILSALAISDEDFGLLAPKTGGQLSVASLSILYRYAILARKLRLSIKDLLLLLNITDIADPFSTPLQTLTLLEQRKAIGNSGFSLIQLDYVLNHVPDSPAGLRQEVVVQYIELLRVGLSNLQDELLSSNETSRELLEKHLSKIPQFGDPDILLKGLDLVEGKWEEDEPSREAFIDDYFSVFIPAAANPKTILTKENFHDGDQLTPAEESAIADRYSYVLTHLYPYLNTNLVIEHFASYFGLSNQQSEILLTKLVLASESLLYHLQQEKLVERDAEGSFVHSIDSTNYPEVFQIYGLVHKHSILLDNFELQPEELAWFIDNRAEVDVLSLEELPVASAPASSLFPRWLNWWKFLEFKGHFPEPENVTFYDILEMGMDTGSSVASIQTALSTLSQREETIFGQLHTGLGLQHGPGGELDYTKAETYRRLWECLKQARRAVVDAETLLRWADRSDPTQQEGVAQEARQAAKSKYEVSEWLKKLQPIQDELREKKRDALVAYLIELSVRNEAPTVTVGSVEMPNSRYWEKPHDLFGYFLIDVEMSACQLTSRIRQAISSVQLFMQRCFLNLESRFVKIPKDDPDLENSWTQWKWMKNYRIWEANRKVFLYPENWIEPELRDDKSPFFKELENEILQKEITHENVEQAFLNYLYKVDEVAKLEIVGVYHDFHGPREEFHVIGRTPTIPHTYFHRSYDLDYLNWSPWEKVEVDITGDHVVPVVYNRKLHLFWLKFEEKTVKIKKNPPAQASDKKSDNPEPAKLLEIQLAWTVKKPDGWTPKKVCAKKLIHPWERPEYSYHIRPRYKNSDNTLWIDLLVSTTEEFNDTRFYDQYAADKVYKTKTRFRETYRPWHSSSFVFNGNVLAVKLRGLRAFYYLPEHSQPKYISSYQYVSENFGKDGKEIEELSLSERGGRLVLPAGSHFEYQHLTNNRVHNPNPNKLSIIPQGFGTKILLQSADPDYQAVMPMQSLATRPFVYQDSERAFFVKTEWKQILADYQTKVSISRYVFYPFYHPYTALFIRELNRSGLDGLLTRKIQTKPAAFYPSNNFDFDSSYQPVSPHEPDESAEKEIVDFSFGGAYSIYNWEMFFHAPMLIAGKLSQNQRFEEAMRWYHYVFDPTNTEDLPVPQRYWITKPFFEHTDEDYRKQRIQNLINKIDEFSDQITAWKNNPFKPHLIARYRPIAYQINTVMKYIDNLIAWGDQLFRRDTMESINEASLLYVLAYELLGERPKSVPAIPRDDKTFNELIEEGALDLFGNTKVEVAVENELSLPIRVVPSSEGTEPMPRLETFYYCLPHNDKLITYWDTVEDRLFKIHHCMNIEGIVRQLPLFAPPIDPALLVKAAAAGVDLVSVLSDLGVPSPRYRFRPLLQAAVQFCNQVKELGEKLLGVLETRDAEDLALLRAGSEIKLQEAIKDIKKLQIDEAEHNIEGLEQSSAIADAKSAYYEGIPRMTDTEEAASILNYLTIATDGAALVLNLTAGITHLIPEAQAGGSGVGGSPHATIKWGGENVASSVSSFAAMSQNISQIMRTIASELEKQGGYTRGEDEHVHQKEVADMEKLQIEKQILAATVRKDISEKDLETHELLIENRKTEEEYLRNKYTNQQLYSWMITQLSSVYFQAYQLAYDMAKRAEKSFQYELSLKASSYIQFGYWDSLKKGLLAGDKLMHDLNRMEAAYYDQNKRELELTKHVSLAQMAPWCLIQLRMAGGCTLDLPEWIFDMDYPGHYMRRIKTVSVSIPCIAGPYSGVHCTLSLHGSRIRMNNLVGSGYPMTDAADDRFRQEYGTIQSIATSHGQNDSGLFQLDFADERFLPFEGAGVISTWGIQMPKSSNRFDFDSISDVILHIQYTARNGGDNLATAARSQVDSVLPQSGVILFSLKRQFSHQWHRFLYPDEAGGDQVLKLAVQPEHYPFYARGKTVKISKLRIVISGRHGGDYRMEIQLPGQPAAEAFDISRDPALNDVHYKEHSTPALPDGLGEWTMKIRRDSDSDFQSLPEDEITDLLIVGNFELS